MEDVIKGSDPKTALKNNLTSIANQTLDDAKKLIKKQTGSRRRRIKRKRKIINRKTRKVNKKRKSKKKKSQKRKKPKKNRRKIKNIFDYV